jgi:hypothetical protein
MNVMTPAKDFRNGREQRPLRCTHSGNLANNCHEFSGILNINVGSGKTSVKTAIRNKRKRSKTPVSILQNNTHVRMAAHTMDTIQELKWNILPYSPDLASSDYHFFLSDIRKLSDHWRKCVANQQDYVEKQQFFSFEE